MISRKSGITIIVPSYNTAEYIEECLSSIFSQSFVEEGGLVDLICVDDASTDKSVPTILKMFEYSGDISCKLISHTSNKGLAAARNSGLSRVVTRYVMFIDSDDLLSPKALECLHSEIEKYKTDICIFEYQHFSPSNKRYARNYSKILFTGKSYAIHNVNSNLGLIHSLSACNKIYHTDFIGDLRFPVNRFYAEDVEFWFLLLERHPKVLITSNATYLYRKRECADSISIMDTSGMSVNNHFEYLGILESIYGRYQHSEPELFTSICWFIQKTLFYYLVRIKVISRNSVDKSRKEFLMRAQKLISKMRIDDRLPAYQKVFYRGFSSNYRFLAYFAGVANTAKQKTLVILRYLTSVNTNSIYRAYSFFSFTYISEILPLLKYSFMLRAKDNQKNVWLFGERGHDAGDNAFALFKHLNSNPFRGRDIYYVCSGKTYEALSNNYGNVVLYGSKTHMRIFERAGVLISTHSRGNIEPFQNKHAVRILSSNYRSKKYVFLGHGITKDDMKSMLGYSNRFNARFDLVLCGSKMEYRDISSRYEYPPAKVVYAPLPRWISQSIYEDGPGKKLKKPSWDILIMFTWRSDFGRNLRRQNYLKERFINRYLKIIQQFLENKGLYDLHQTKNVTIHLVLHPETESTIEKYGIVLPELNYIKRHAPSELSKLIRLCDLLVTDYSSIAFDFAYFKKPTIYYQFDGESYRQSHYSQGYFIYEIHGFGPVCRTDSKCVEIIREYLFQKHHSFLHKRHLHFQYDNSCVSLHESINSIL